MNQRDPLEAFENALFSAARRERSQTDALERTMTAVRASQGRRRQRRVVATLSAALALAAAAALVVRTNSNGESIEAEHIAPKHSAAAVAGSPAHQAEPVEVPAPAASDDAASLRSGIAPSVVATTLEEETAMLQSARAELQAGKADSALSLLDQYDKVSGGHLTAEATLLRIQALSKSGRASLAAKLAQRLVDSDPNGAVAERARAYLSQPDSSRQKP